MIDSVIMFVLAWLMWEVMSHLFSNPADAETGEPIRPPLSLSQWYLNQRWKKDA